MVFNQDLQFSHASIGADTLSEERGAFIEWDVSQVTRKMDTSSNEFEFNVTIGDDICNGDGIKYGDSRSAFLLRLDCYTNVQILGISLP
jgi:hypothetical protein